MNVEERRKNRKPTRKTKAAPSKEGASSRKILYIFFGGFFGVFALVGGILGWVFFFAAPLGGPEIDAAVAFARNSPRVRAVVGDRVELTKTRGGFVRRSVNAKVDATLSLRGTRGEAEVAVIGFRLGERAWEFTTFELVGEGAPENLLSAE